MAAAARVRTIASPGSVQPLARPSSCDLIANLAKACA
jgi:hypothetical protein